ncbi:MAG: ABC transporter permease [Chloroflexi bacterium]|nr:ABC transporter permease [Chloroflexota bacterium]
MAETSAVPAPSSLGRIGASLGRYRELSLFIIMLVLGALVALQAPQFISVSNLSQVSTLASIIAVAAVGQALVIITRNIDLSIESTIGLVAFVVADLLAKHVVDVPLAMATGVALGLLLGMGNGVLVAVFRIPAIVATLGTLSIYRGLSFLLAGGRQVTLTQLPDGYTSAARADLFGVPIFLLVAIALIVVVGVALRRSRFGRQLYAVGSNPEAASILGIRTNLVIFVAFALAGLFAGIAGVMWGMYFGTINASAATGSVLQIVAACVVGGVAIFGGSGTVVGAGLGALFLGFIQNALIILRLSQFWLGAIYGVVILVAVAADAVILRRLRRTQKRRPNG